MSALVIGMTGEIVPHIISDVFRRKRGFIPKLTKDKYKGRIIVEDYFHVYEEFKKQATVDINGDVHIDHHKVDTLMLKRLKWLKGYSDMVIFKSVPPRDTNWIEMADTMLETYHGEIKRVIKDTSGYFNTTGG